MASPISIGDAIQLVQGAVALYKKIKNAPEEIATIGKRLEDLGFYLWTLQDLLNDRRRHSLANLRPEVTKRLQRIISDIRVDTEDVTTILDIWNSAGKIERVFFSMGRNPRKLENLSSSIDDRKKNVSDMLQILGLFGIQSLASDPASLTPHATPEAGVIFVDPHNLGRSKIAEGYIKLLGEWTVRTGGTWRIKFAHSAGMRVRNRSDCSGMLTAIKPPVPISDGNRTPNGTAMASLFDNKYFDYPYKSGIKRYMEQSRSRGITTNIFKTYDYILVFTGREYENLLRFQQALIAANGPDMAPRGKGRILHLGAYLSNHGKPVEITDAPKAKDGTDSRANWNVKTSQIKLVVKVFMKNELAWVQPVKGDQQS
ncbi:hypothetical protein LTR37_020115 [Vermiconidia calcicola]|uniref:Uncharacterized protein n=1 Tax=Vermiconidia calcicola TaxID=1690605 RepID=A0ACC3MCD6_9PEZI|nr:hypothetical protein LTR37_020115 [Vermiconidia calcicola]